MTKLFEFILAATIFLTATAYLPGKGMDTAQGVAFRIGVVALMVMSFSLKPLRFIVNKWVNMLLGLCFILTLTLPSSAQAAALNPFTNVFLGVMLFYLIANYAKGEMILNALCLVIIANAFMTLLQFLGIDPLIVRATNNGRPDMTGLFEFRYAFGVYMGVLAPVLFMCKRKFFGLLAAILTICSACYAAIGIMFLSFVALSYKTRFYKPIAVITIICVALGLGVALKVPKDHPNSIIYKVKSRLEMQSRFILPVLKKPMGYGLGCFRHIGPRIANGQNGPWGDVTDGWSDYLERTMELGLGFLILFGFLIINAYKRGALILIGIPLNMAFHSCLNHFNLCVLFITLLAMLEVRLYKELT